MGIEEIFADVQFDDAQLNLGGSEGNPGGTPSPGDTGKTDAGQKSEPQPDTEDQDAETKDPDDDGVEETPSDGGKKDKPLPYDQDPKWKSARADQKLLKELLQEHAFLDVEELREALKEGKSLREALGDRDPKRLLDDSEYANRVRKNWEAEEQKKAYADETADERSARLEAELEKRTKEFEAYKASVEDRQFARQVIDNFSKEVDRVIEVESEDQGFSESERKILTMFLGVDNPGNMIDIRDKAAIRRMAKDGVGKFRQFVKEVGDAAIQKYVDGKRELSVDSSKKSSSTVKPKAPPTNKTDPNPRPVTNDEIDEVFNAGSRQFAEILQQGLKAAT